jgi:hypothetical protein
MISVSSCRHVGRFGILVPAILALMLAETPCGLLALPQASPSKFLKRHGFSWRTEETAHFLIHYEANSFAEKELGALTRAHEHAVPRILELLGESAPPEKIHIFAVEDRARMKALTGRETIGQAIGDQNSICCVFSKSTQAVGAHEVMHIISSKKWGGRKSGLVWLGEGLAVYADDNWRGYNLHALCRYLRDSGKLVPLGHLMGKMTSYPYMISYPECGSFVKFLYERYGREKLKELWKAPRVDNMHLIFGKDLSGLEAEWHTVINGADARSIQYDVKSR